VTFSAYSDATAANDTTYHYIVTASDTSSNESGNSAEVSATPQAPPPPSAPSSLTATAVSTGRIDLAWGAASGAGSYTIKRATMSGGPYEILETGHLTTAYSDTTAAPRTTYYYVVVAVNGGGETSSAEASARIEDLHLRLKFDESSGATAADSSGNGRNASLLNGAVFAAGRLGNAVVFNSASSQYATLPAGLVSTLDNFTISTWVKPTTLANWARVFDFGTGTATNMFLTLQSGATGKPRFAIKVNNSAEQILDAPDALATGVWAHIAIRLSGGTGTLYVNGAAVATNNAMSFKPSSMGNTTQNYLGRSQYPDPYFHGAIDDFRIYRSALSAADIAALAAGQLPAPQNLAAAPGRSRITLSWGAVSGSSGYTVRRAAAASGPYTDRAVAISSTIWADTGLADEATWYYTVHALGIADPGVVSAPVSATTYSAIENWRHAYFGTPDNSGDAADFADPDGDGAVNVEEYVAGTDPTSSTSVLRISSLDVSGDDIVVSFPTVSGKTYRLEGSDTLEGDSWTIVQDDIPGTGDIVQVVDPEASAHPSRFYRVVVQ
jgi:hypothetical protein